MTTPAPDWADEISLAACGPTEQGLYVANALRAAYERGKADAKSEIEKLRKLDREAATYVEAVICMRSMHFTGEPPYIGWKGLGKALNEDYNDRDKGERSGRIKGLREAADMSDNWKPIRRLLPDATDNHNEGAFVGQHEASERIANAIRFRADELEQESVNTDSPPPRDEV